MRGLYGGHSIVGRRSRFSEDGKVVATAGEGGLFVYSTFTSKRVAKITKYQIRSFDFVPNQCTRVCVLTLHGLIMIWDYSAQRIELSKNLGPNFSTVVDMVESLGKSAYLLCNP